MSLTNMKNIYLKYICSLILFIILVNPVFSLTLEDTINDFRSAINRYENNEISISQLIVYLEFYRYQSNNYLSDNNLNGWSRDDAIAQFGNDNLIIFETDTLDVRLGTWSVGTEDWDPYAPYRRIHYFIEPKPQRKEESGDNLKQDIEMLMDETKAAYNSGTIDLENLHERYLQVQSRIIDNSRNECEAAMDALKADMDIFYESFGVGKRYYTYLVRGTSIEECEAIRCDSDYFHYGDEYTCHDDCRHPSNWDFIMFQVLCSEHGNVGMSSPLAEGHSPPPIMEGVETPDPKVERRIVEFVQAFDELREKSQQECITPMYKPNIYLRELLQESFNLEFMNWYVNEFMGNDLERNEFAERGFRGVLSFIMDLNNKIHNDLHCKIDMSSNPSQYIWPEEFQEINFNYNDGNIELDVWERKVDYRNIPTWSTFYTYRYIPPRDIAKELLRNKISSDIARGRVGPPPEDLEQMRSEPQFLELVDRLTGRFGGSIDFKIILEDENDVLLEKYVEINSDKIISITAQELDDIDFTLSIDADAIYDFMETITSFDSDTVRGQFWADLSGSRGPSFTQGINAIFTLWNGVSISPWFTRIRLMRSIRDIIEFVQTMDEIEDARLEGRMPVDSTQRGTIDDSSMGSEDQYETISGELDSVRFMFDTPAGTTKITAINLDSGTPNLHYETHESETIVSYTSQQAWMLYKEYDDGWQELTQIQSWNSIWEMYYEDQFSSYYSMILNTEANEISEHSIRIYNIERNPSVSHDLFQPN